MKRSSSVGAAILCALTFFLQTAPAQTNTGTAISTNTPSTTNTPARSLADGLEPVQKGFAAESVNGTVDHLPEKGGRFKVDAQRRTLGSGDRLETQKNSAARVLANQEVIRMDQLSRLKIVDPRTVRLLGGNIYLKSLGTPVGAGASAPTLVMTPGGISLERQGTEFHLSVDEETGAGQIVAVDGRVRVSQEDAFKKEANNPRETVLFGPANSALQVQQASEINDLIQWMLYYPAVLDPGELPWGESQPSNLELSLKEYRSGNVLKALEAYPAERAEFGLDRGPAELLYHAALLLAVGRVDEVEKSLGFLAPTNAVAPIEGRAARLALALRQLIKAVKLQSYTRPTESALASEWLAESYYLQSRGQLPPAREAARKATLVSTNLGFAWARLAELEFSFGEIDKARHALDRALHLAPANAQAVALAGFLLAARDQIGPAITQFTNAIALDPGLGNAWLGLGLCHIRQGKKDEGLRELQIAVAAEPQRALLRSYLGKAYHHAGLDEWANKELQLARKTDPKDPTPLLYSALLRRQQNQINAAVRELESSQDLNDNRALYRSRLLLDQDRAVSGANLAAIYRDAGMSDVSLREATRAVQSDYANYSAHLFLAESYGVLNDAGVSSLRYETAWANELFLANLLAPVGGSSLSQTISQHEYSRLFDRDHLGVFSLSEYTGNGDWGQTLSQYGRVGNTAYSLDGLYLNQNGQRANNDQELVQLWLTVQQQLSPKDTVLAEVIYKHSDFGDLNQYYDPADASRNTRGKDTQEPIALAGYHRHWNPAHHTLLVLSRLQDTLKQSSPDAPGFVVIRNPDGSIVPDFPGPIPFTSDVAYENDLEIYSAELQHIWQPGDARTSTILGGRFQTGQFTTDTALTRPEFPFFPPIAYTTPLTNQSVESDFHRASLYAYQNVRLFDPLLLTAGVAYDSVHYPVNHLVPPVSADEDTKDQVSPKAGFIWTPYRKTTVRGSYTRSLGGVSFDQSFRIEPSQVSGFLQSFRSLIPESVAGSVPAASFETWGVSLEQRVGRSTYAGLSGEWLESEGSQSLGVFSTRYFAPIAADTLRSHLMYREKNLLLTLNQLLGDEWALGARYRLSHASLAQSFNGYPDATTEQSATLHQLHLNVLFHHPCGFFSQLEGGWNRQINDSPDQPGDDFWQFNLFAGYRFLQRRAEVRLGLLNLTDQDYRLNPLNLHAELPRDRTFYAGLKLNF